MSVECLEVLVIHAAKPIVNVSASVHIDQYGGSLFYKVIPLFSAQKSTFTTVFLTFFGIGRKDGRISDDRVTFGLDSERNYPSLL